MGNYYQPEIETMPVEKLQALQSERLVEQVKYVYEHVKFYRDRMDEKGVKPEDIRGIEDLHLLPFLTKDDLRVFKLLISVNGVGPKGALAILSVLTPDDLRFAVIADDAKAISKAPGIGAKTAQRVVLELKDKLKLEDAFSPKEELVKNPVFEQEKGVRQEALLALTSLGYSASEATSVLSGIEITPESDVEAVLKLALKSMAFI